MNEKNYPDLINKGPDPDLTLKLGTLLSRPATGSYTVRLKTAVTALVILPSLWLAPGSLSAMDTTGGIAEEAGAVFVPNDPCIIGCAPYGVPWYLEAIGAYEAWEVTTGSDDVLILSLIHI